MANSYHQIYIQAVFAVRYRNALIAEAWQHELFAVIGNLINETGCQTIIVNGVADHVHCLFGLKPTVALSEVMKVAKAKSSKWLNESRLLAERFEWQEGYGHGPTLRFRTVSRTATRCVGTSKIRLNTTAKRRLGTNIGSC